MAPHLEQRQKIKLSQKMIQSARILQMSGNELSDYLKELELENPIVILQETDFAVNNPVKPDYYDWLAKSDEQNRAYSLEENYSEDYFLENMGEWRRKTLADFLKMQLIHKPYSKFDFQVFEYIAQCLDSKGYFTSSPDELSAYFQISKDQAEKYLEIMRALEPAGVCAASLKECLLTQLRKSEKKDETAETIITEYLELLGKNQLPVIAKKMGISIDKVRMAALHIKKLNPIPAQGFEDGHVQKLIIPDVSIVRRKDGFHIVAEDEQLPSIIMNEDYLSLLNSECPKEVKEYLDSKMKQAEEVQKNIRMRGETLLKLAKYILEEQYAFFVYGEDQLKPLRLKDAAERMEFHESTISRAVKDKYLKCAWGVYPFSYFFSKSIKNDTGEMAAVQMKRKVKELIDGEDKSKPYSDQKLSGLLKEMGIQMSRRTVTKYREQMQIPDSRGRKEY